MVSNTEPWFIPIDIIMLFSISIAILLGTLYLLIIIFDRTCRNVLMLLVANSCLSEIVFGCIMLSVTMFMLENDFNRVQYYDSYCVFRGYMAYVVTFLQNCSYLLQAVYRYLVVVYPTRFIWHSLKFQLTLIFIMWIIGFVCPVPLIAANRITYNGDNQICQMPFEFSVFMVYNALCVYIIPISLLVLVYFKLVQYVRQLSRNITTANTLMRAQRELRMIYHLIILVSGIVIIGFPYTLLVFISFFTNPPKYHYRIAYIFVNVTLPFEMLAILFFTEPLKISVKKRLKLNNNITFPMRT